MTACSLALFGDEILRSNRTMDLAHLLVKKFTQERKALHAKEPEKFPVILLEFGKTSRLYCKRPENF